MKLRLDKEALKTAYQTSLVEIEADLARLAAFLGLDLEELDPYTFSPDEKDFYYINNRPSYDMFMNSLRRYALVDTKLKELEEE